MRDTRYSLQAEEIQQDSIRTINQLYVACSVNYSSNSLAFDAVKFEGGWYLKDDLYNKFKADIRAERKLDFLQNKDLFTCLDLLPELDKNGKFRDCLTLLDYSLNGDVKYDSHITIGVVSEDEQNSYDKLIKVSRKQWFVVSALNAHIFYHFFIKDKGFADLQNPNTRELLCPMQPNNSYDFSLLKSINFGSYIHNEEHADGNKIRKSVLYAALLQNNSFVINILNEAGYNFNEDQGCSVTFSDGIVVKQSVLSFAVEQGNIDMINILNEAGYNFNEDQGCSVTHPDGVVEKKSVLYWAVEKGNIDMINILNEAGYNFNEDHGLSITKPDGVVEKKSVLYWAVERGGFEVITALRNINYDFNEDQGLFITKPDGAVEKKSVLFCAVEQGNIDMINILDEAGYNFNEDHGYDKKKDGAQIFISSLYKGIYNKDVVNALFHAGYNFYEDQGFISINAGVSHYISPLYLGIDSSNIVWLNSLKENNYNFNLDAIWRLTKSDGTEIKYSVLGILIDRGKIDVINRLLTVGYNLVQDQGMLTIKPDGTEINYSALAMLIIDKRDLEFIRVLGNVNYDFNQDRGLSITKPDGVVEKKSVLYWAVEQRDLAVITALGNVNYDFNQDQGLSITKPNGMVEKKSPLFCAVERRNIEVIQELKEHNYHFAKDGGNIKINSAQQYVESCSSLYKAIAMENPEMVNKFTEFTPGYNLTTDSGHKKTTESSVEYSSSLHLASSLRIIKGHIENKAIYDLLVAKGLDPKMDRGSYRGRVSSTKIISELRR